MYSIKRDQWQEAPKLNEMRHSHSGCTLGNFIYIFFGKTTKRGVSTYLDSIERLDAQAYIDSDWAHNDRHEQSWELIQTTPVKEAIISARIFAFVAPLSPTEFFILGGFNDIS